MDKELRLDKFLADMGKGTRSALKEADVYKRQYLYPLQSRAFVFPPDIGRPAGKSLCLPLLKGRRQIAGPVFAKNDI